MMDRRLFLRRLGFGTVASAAAAIGVLDIERLLWRASDKTIVIPALRSVETLHIGDIVTFVGGPHFAHPVTGLYAPQEFRITATVTAGPCFDMIPLDDPLRVRRR